MAGWQRAMVRWATAKLARMMPTWALQDALEGRPGVQVEYIGPGQTRQIDVVGVAVVTINCD